MSLNHHCSVIELALNGDINKTPHSEVCYCVVRDPMRAHSSRTLSNAGPINSRIDGTADRLQRIVTVRMIRLSADTQCR